MVYYKNLVGRIDLTKTGDYYFSLPAPLKGTLPNALDNQVIEEVYIICNTSDPINIYLPSTTLFNDTWNAKIYITNIQSGTVTIYPFQGSDSPFIQPDTLNGAPFYAMTGQYEAVYLHIVDDYFWMKLVCPAPVLIP